MAAVVIFKALEKLTLHFQHLSTGFMISSLYLCVCVCVLVLANKILITTILTVLTMWQCRRLEPLPLSPVGRSMHARDHLCVLSDGLPQMPTSPFSLRAAFGKKIFLTALVPNIINHPLPMGTLPILSLHYNRQ